MKKQSPIKSFYSDQIFQVNQSTKLNSASIQNIYERLKQNFFIKNNLKYFFDFLQHLKSLKHDPLNQQTKQKILLYLESDQNLSQISKEQNKQKIKVYLFNNDNFYLMNKAGGIGTIERMCKFTQKGVFQFQQGKKQPKLKQIKGFNNQLQMKNSKTNFSKLQWVRQQAKYPLRMILVDKNNSHKGVYFRSFQEAESVRMYLIHKYNSQMQCDAVKKALNNVATLRSNSLIQNVCQLFLLKFRQRKQSQISKRSGKGQDNSEISSLEKGFQLDNFIIKNKLENENVFQDDRTSKTRSWASNKTVIRENNKIESFKSNKNIKKYHQKIILNFFHIWQSKAQLSRQISLRGTFAKQQPQFQAIIDKIEKKISSYENQELESMAKRNLIFKKISFYSQIRFPFKPKLTCQLRSTNSREKNMSKIFYYNSFLSNSNHQKNSSLTYQLIINKYESNDISLSQTTIELKGEIQKYSIKISLINMITEQLITQNLILLRDIYTFGQDFSISLKNSSIYFENKQSEEPFQDQIICKIQGRIIALKKQTQQDKIFSYLLNQLPHSELLLSPLNQRQEEIFSSNEKQQNKIDDQDLKSHIALLPIIDEKTKQDIQRLKMCGDFYYLNQSLDYVPIQNLSRLCPTDQQYQILTRSAKVFRKTNIPSFFNSYLSILRNLVKLQLFQTQNHLQESFLGIIAKWSGNFLNCEDKQNSLGRLIGFEAGQIDKVSEKIIVLIDLFQFILEGQCPKLLQKMKRRNIPISWLMLEYSNNLLAINFQPKLWLLIISSIFNDLKGKCSQILMILVVVYLCNFWQHELKNCYKLEEIQYLFESQTINQSRLTNISFSTLWSYAQHKYEEYFFSYGKSQFDKIRSKFYSKQSAELSLKKQQRLTEKSAIAEKFIQVSQDISKNVPFYKPKSHCLHVYFVTLPSISGSLYLKTELTEFQCTGYQNNSYFVLPDIISPVKVQFIDSKSNEYSFNLIFDIGFGYFKQEVKNSKNSSSLLFTYWAGLFQNSTMNQNYKNTTHIEKSHSSFLEILCIKNKLNKQLQYSKLITIIDKLCYSNGKENVHMQELGRKIKTIFSQSHNKINEYDLFLHFLAKSKLSFKQKMMRILDFSRAIHSELFLSQNHSFQRIIFYDFIKLIEVPISFRDFEAFYQNTLYDETQISSPKILKARFYFEFQQKSQIKLQNQLYNYIQQRASKYLYSDIQLPELITYLKPIIMYQLEILQNQKGKKIVLNQGELKLVISSEGEVQHYGFKINIKNNNRQFSIDQSTFLALPQQAKFQQLVPKILSNNIQSLTFSTKLNQKVQNSPSNIKISSRFKDTSKSVGQNNLSILKQVSKSESKMNNDQQFNSFHTNLCKHIIPAAKKIIRLRYKKYPRVVKFRNFDFLEDLHAVFIANKSNAQILEIKEIYLDGKKINSFKFLQNTKIDLKIGENQNAELVNFQRQIGIKNNINSFLSNEGRVEKLYFVSIPRISRTKQPLSKVLVNHGFGVIRWENCYVKGFFKLKRQKKNKPPKKHYLLLLSGKERIVEEKYLSLNNEADIVQIGQITAKNLTIWQQYRC